MNDSIHIMQPIADVSYNIASDEYRDNPFPSASELLSGKKPDIWHDEIGSYEISTVADKNNTKVDYLKLDADDFQIIMPIPIYTGDINRKIYTNTPHYVKRTCVDTTMHSYNTRSSHKYKNNIAIVLENVNDDTISTIVDTISIFYPDLSNYHARRSVSGEQSIIIEPLVDRDNESIRFIGSVSSIINIFHTGYIYSMLDSLLNQIDDNKTKRMTVAEYDTCICNKIADNNYIKKDCSICLGNIHLNDSISITKCNHVYHEHCLRKWLTEECTTPSCPTCRNNLLDID